MNNVTQIKAARLTEIEVHNAIKEIIDNGNKATSLNILKELGRGSLTTITKFINTYDKKNIKENTTNLPSLAEVPEELTNISKQLIIKIWNEAQTIADKEINVQREALNQAELKAEARIKEAEDFSEEQTKKIESLEKNKAELEETNKNNIEKIIELKNDIYSLKLESETQKIQLDTKTKELENEKNKLKTIENDKDQIKILYNKLEGEFKAWKELKPKTVAKKVVNKKTQTQKQKTTN